MQNKYTGRPRRIMGRKNDEQYMLRLPPGMRARLEQRVDAGGRSINTEIIDAIEKHLTSADRITQLWEFFQKHVHGANAK